MRRVTLTLKHGETSPHRLTVPYDLPAGEWTVRVKRAAAPSDDDRTYDDVVWAAVRSFQPDGADYGGQTRLALRIRASGQLQGRIDRLSGSVDQLIPAWDGSAWVDDQVTSNPAWIYRWYARGVREDGELVAGAGLAAMSVDDAELQRWGAWCTRHGLTFNYVLDRDVSHAEMLSLIAQCGRAAPSWHTGRLGVVYDEEDRAPTFYYGPGNVVDGSMEVDWISGAIAEEVVVRYRDPDLDWQYNAVRRNVPQVTAPDRTATLTRDGITDRAQAAKECNLQAARQLYHRRRLRWQAGPEALSRARGHVGYLSHALVSGGVTGRVLRGTRAELTLSTPVALPAVRPDGRADDYLLLMLPDGRLHTSQISRAPGSTDPDETDRVTLATPLPEELTAHGSIPLDTLWRHYLEDTPPIKVKLVSVEPQSNGSVALEAIDEVAEYYAAATSDLTVDLPALRRRWPRVLGIEISELLIRAAGGYVVKLTATLDVDGDWRGGEILAALDDGPEKLVARLLDDETEGTWTVPNEGTVRIRAVPGSAAAPAGRSHTVTHTIVGSLAPPAGAAGLTLRATSGGYVARWAASAAPDYAYTEILDGAADDNADDDGLSAATPRGTIAGTVFSRVDAPEGALRVWVRHVDQQGVAGPATHADVDPDPAGGVAWRGPLVAGIQYRVDHAGSRQGYSWICVRDLPDNNPTGALLPLVRDDGTLDGRNHWELLAAAGDDGVEGEGIDWRGPWVANADPPYEDQDAVSHNGRSYIANGDPDATTRPPGSTWQLMAEAGTDGKPGFLGVGAKLVYRGQTRSVAHTDDPGDWFIGSDNDTPVARDAMEAPAARWMAALADTAVMCFTDRDDSNIRRYLTETVDPQIDLVAMYLGRQQWADWFINSKTVQQYQWVNALGVTQTLNRVILGVTLLEWRMPVADADVEFPGAGENVTFLFSHAPGGEGAPTIPVAAAPTVTIDAVATLEADETATLSATLTGGAYDSVARTWAVVSGGGTVDDPNAEEPVYTPVAGTSRRTPIEVMLTVVVDGDGTTAVADSTATGSGTVTFYVIPADGQLPAANLVGVAITGPTTVTENNVATFELSIGEASIYDILEVLWSVSPSDIGTVTVAQDRLSIEYDAGEISLDRSVMITTNATGRGNGTDARDNTSDTASDTHTFTQDHVAVDTDPRPPRSVALAIVGSTATATVSWPNDNPNAIRDGWGARVTRGTSDPAGSPVYDFRAGPFGRSATSASETRSAFLTPGTYYAHVRARSGTGRSVWVTSAAVVVSATPPTPTPPTPPTPTPPTPPTPTPPTPPTPTPPTPPTPTPPTPPTPTPPTPPTPPSLSVSASASRTSYVQINATAAFLSGNFSASPSGGTAPYRYRWSGISINPAYDGDEQAILGGSRVPFPAGGSATATVTVTDAAGQTASASATIRSP